MELENQKIESCLENTHLKCVQVLLKKKKDTFWTCPWEATADYQLVENFQHI